MIARLFAGSIVAIALTGCWVDPASNRRPDTTGPTVDAGAEDTAPAEVPKMSIDTDRTLHASPGAGAGVYITYTAGGTWNVVWTCDSDVSPGSSCDYQISINTTGLGDVSTVPSSALTQRDTTAFSLRTTTTSTLDSATFHTEPGEPITFSMRLNGRPYSDLVWFVNDGTLSNPPVDPFELVPKSP